MAKTGRPSGRDPKWNKDKARWELRVSVVGSRGKPSTKLVFNDKLGAQDVDGARLWAASATELVQTTKSHPSILNRTCDAQFDLVCIQRSKEGVKSVDNSRFRWAHVSPVIGVLVVRNVVASDLAKLVQTLNEKVREGVIEWTYAQAIWRLTRRVFAMSCSDNWPGLKVMDDNPAKGIIGPRAGLERERQFLFPTELLAVTSYRAVPRRWRRRIAISVYIGTRGGELDALDLETGISLEHGWVSIHQAIDQKTGKLGPTKSKNRRRFKFEVNIRPLLEAIHAELGGVGRVAPMPEASSWSREFRKYLGKAVLAFGLPIRAELFLKSPTTRRITWHDLRHTYLTWRAIRAGENPFQMQRAAGHSKLEQTLAYVNAVEVYDQAAFGEVFPELPKSLLGGFGKLAGNTKTLPATRDNRGLETSRAGAVGAHADVRKEHLDLVETPSDVAGQVPNLREQEKALTYQWRAAEAVGNWELAGDLYAQLTAVRVQLQGQKKKVRIKFGKRRGETKLG